ncbi:RNA polymerase sigma factor [Pedobacter chitinilyticus]|uniref:RNA polymerase sigma-70 factor n=1 Tax=Pedobacter chitinilyticus TaxID=2233776 RepID=A0A443YVY1_9SPHI|nr:RNA polymerase sigma-70 factor [Pedobacter chitinilyticus]RWU08160.1 RNA polymerase sigma-70 factor [Pedobacter chitinilyticus]
MKTAVANDSELLVALKQGDHRAFHQIYDLYKIELGLRILRMVRSSELAEELLQDLFLRLWNSRDRINIETSLRAYLYQVAKNMVIDLMRRATREQQIYSQIIAASTELYEHVEQALFQKENHAMLQRAIDQLPPQRRKIFVHCKLEGMSYKEVAELYQVSTTTVNDHIQKSMHTIREYLLKRPGLQLSIILGIILGSNR